MKRKFFVFCFSFIPGAGQMYQGYMKRGLSFMLLFGGTCVLSAVTVEEFLFLLPVIWAYSFFDAFNIARMTPLEKEQKPDCLLINIEYFAKDDFNALYAKRHRWLGIGAIVFGMLMLYNNFIAPILWQVYYAYEMKWLAQMLNRVPSFIIAVSLVFIGYRMLKSYSKKKQPQDDIVEYKEVNKNV